MPITIAGSGTITGISAGGLPDDSIVTADIANGAVTQAKRSEQLTLGTAQNSTSGTSIDFTGIPSWVKRVQVLFNAVSTTGSSNYVLQVGTSSGIVSTGYTGGASYGSGFAYNSSSFILGASIFASGQTHSGIATIATLGSNVWAHSGTMSANTSSNMAWSAGAVTLSGTLDRVRITTVNGTDTFDAGSINILYE